MNVIKEFQIVAGSNSRHTPLNTYRNNQTDALNVFVPQLNNPKFYGLLNHATGSGKSLIIKDLVFRYNNKNQNNKSLIIVPDLVLGEAFTKESYFTSIDGCIIDWRETQGSCMDFTGTSPSKVNEILFFLENKNRIQWDERVAICSHTAFCNAFKLKPNTFQNLFIVIDEAHAIKLGQDESLKNRLGNFVDFVFYNPNKNISLLAATATNFRGDRIDTLGEHQKEFIAHHYMLDEYLSDVNYLKNVHNNFILCKDNRESYKKLNKVLIKNEPTLIFVGGDSTDQENNSLQNALRIKNLYSKEEQKWVIDMVDPANRTNKYKFIRDQKNQNKILCIIALETCQQGFDWPNCKHVINVSQTLSVVRNIQRTGRVLRDFQNKPEVFITQMVIANDNIRDIKQVVDTLISLTVGLYCMSPKQFREKNIKTFNDIPVLKTTREVEECFKRFAHSICDGEKIDLENTPLGMLYSYDRKKLEGFTHFKLSPEQKILLIETYKNSDKKDVNLIKKIALELSISENAVLYHIRQAGLLYETTASKRQNIHQRIIKDRQEGKTITELINKYFSGYKTPLPMQIYRMKRILATGGLT